MISWIASAAAATRRIADRPADDDVVRAAPERGLDGYDALLVADRPVVDRPDARRHDEQRIVDRVTQRGHLHAGGDHAVAAGLERAASPRQHQRGDIAVETEIVQIAAIETRQHRYGEHFQRVAFVFGRCLHDRLVAVHGDEACAAVLELAHRRTDRRGNIEELEIAEDLLVARKHPVEQVEVAAAHHELESELVERHGIAELLGKRAGALAVRDVHRENQAVPGRDVLVFQCEPLSALPRRRILAGIRR